VFGADMIKNKDNILIKIKNKIETKMKVIQKLHLKIKLHPYSLN
jgi:hypothetical protein